MRKVVIEHSPKVDDNIVLLDHHDSIAGYAATYGDRICEWYEDHKLIIVPFWPVEADHEFLQGLTMPGEFAKIGSLDGVDRPLFERKAKTLISRNPIANLEMELPLKVYLRDQISGVFAQLRRDLPLLFPRYRMQEGNITFRYTPVEVVDTMHVDIFKATSKFHRVKIFLNMDANFRVWHTSYDLLRVVELYKDLLSDITTDIDRNKLNKLINERIGPVVPRHVVRYPMLSCVIANGETLLHEVVSGSRMIAMEYLADIDSMLDTGKYIGTTLPQHMRDLGYSTGATAPAA